MSAPSFRAPPTKRRRYRGVDGGGAAAPPADDVPSQRPDEGEVAAEPRGGGSAPGGRLSLVDGPRRRRDTDASAAAGLPLQVLCHLLRFDVSSALHFSAVSRGARRAARRDEVWSGWRPKAAPVADNARPAPTTRQDGEPKRPSAAPAPRVARRPEPAVRNWLGFVQVHADRVDALLRDAAARLHAAEGLRDDRRARAADLADKLRYDLRTLHTRRRELKQYHDSFQAVAVRRLALLGRRGANELLGPRALANLAPRTYHVYFDGVVQREIGLRERTLEHSVRHHGVATAELQIFEAQARNSAAAAREIARGSTALRRLLSRPRRA
ncbi:hypothetical protein M885DRAFT_562807 [Pelagophyceae sp. CCMP2097]|nr:hypothetical protein M885DRAFT_562807 [Pelagophyceae sp. CCMP2097]